MKKILFAVFMIGALLISHNAECRVKGNLYNVLKNKDQVKVFVHDTKDATAARKMDLGELRREMEDALTSRKSINFKIVSQKEDADIIITCDVKEFVWMEEDPIDDVYGLEGVILDAVMTYNYARVQAVFSVIDGASGKVLWTRKLKATLTQAEMDEEKSIPLVNERIIKIFMRKCFSKAHG